MVVQEYLSLAGPLLAVAGPVVGIGLGLTIYRQARLKERQNRPD